MKKIITDGASAVGEIAYKLSEVMPIYPITPSSPIAEYCTSASSKGKKNLFDQDVKMIEMQSEAGVAGTLHGSLLAHALSSTCTSSQGLLLMLPNLYKMVGECLPTVIHVSARAIASHALSIFCDHTDVMATRMTGAIILSSCSPQECADMALASHVLAMKSSLPVIHFFDGFRTSHEIQKIDMYDDEEIKLVAKDYFSKFKGSFKEAQFGSAQNPDVFFQNRERISGKYTHVNDDLRGIFSDIKALRNTSYDVVEYYGAQDAERIVVAMGSSCKTIEEFIDCNPNEKIGLLKVRLYRPFSDKIFIEKIPKSAKIISVLDRTKENGAIAPLAQDVISSLAQNNVNVKVLHGRYGLGGKEFTPSCVKAIFDNMKEQQKNDFTVGIVDDLFSSSLTEEEYFPVSKNKSIKIFGLGSDGSVSASKSTIKILGECFNQNVQGYFEYDSKKSGSLTISHLRISSEEIKSEYLLNESDIISINNFSFVHRYDCLEGLKEHGVVIINSIFSDNEIGRVLPKEYVDKLKSKKAKLFIIDAQKIASECGLGQKINIVMMSALFKGASLLNDGQIREEVSKYINSMFAKKGQEVVEKNLKAMEDGLGVKEVDISKLEGKVYPKSLGYNDKFYNDIMLPISKLKGNQIPLSKFNEDGSSPLGTSKFEKRGFSLRLPKWIKANCIQCGQCVLACPHSALSALLIDPNENSESSNLDSFSSALGLKDKLYKISLSPKDCTGCGVCAKTCPAIKKALEIFEVDDLTEKTNEYEKDRLNKKTTQKLFSPLTYKGIQFNESFFKFPGACAGCGETPYLKLLTMLNGTDIMIANATGCSSIYAGTFGSCPYQKDENGKGIFWANSLFEDNAEFGLGLKLGNQFGRNSSKPVWIIGGDGWAYDIGYGGLDHVLASGENVNILVLDNQTYSNTGGQQSKATPTGAKVKFAENGKKLRKKNLGEIALTYKDVFVSQVSFGANMNHTIKALKEAQEYEGVSIVIAYCTCVNQGFDMSNMTAKMKEATDCGFWPIYIYNPKNKKLELASEIDEEKYNDFLKTESRFLGADIALIQRQKNQSIELYNSLKNIEKNGK